MTKVLVLGGTGAMGKHLVNFLAADIVFFNRSFSPIILFSCFLELFFFYGVVTSYGQFRTRPWRQTDGSNFHTSVLNTDY